MPSFAVYKNCPCQRALWRLLLLSAALVLCALANVPCARADEGSVVVDLFKAHKDVRSLELRGPCRIAALQAYGNEKFKVVAQQGQLSVFEPSSAGVNKSQPVIRRATLVACGLGGRGLAIRLADGTLRHYRGSVHLSVDKQNRIKAQNQVTFRDYVYSVVGSESLSHFSLEALKAQSVLTQTRMARYKIGDRLNDTTEGEAYSGCDYERPLVKKAVDLTWGRRLSFQARPIEIFYHAACAGATSSAELFGGEVGVLPYYRSVKCSYCRSSPFWKPLSMVLPEKVYFRSLPSGVPAIDSLDQAGRPLRLHFPNGKIDSGYAFWLTIGQRFGWDKMPGTRFKIGRGVDGRISLESTGAGHGVGLCQWGSAEMARQGKSYEQILRYYFPDCEVLPKEKKR